MKKLESDIQRATERIKKAIKIKIDMKRETNQHLDVSNILQEAEKGNIKSFYAHVPVYDERGQWFTSVMEIPPELNDEIISLLYDYMQKKTDAEKSDKEVKDAEETINISKKEYEHLLRLAQYVSNWCNMYLVCPVCGTYNPEGYICINCGHDRRTKQKGNNLTF